MVAIPILLLMVPVFAGAVAYARFGLRAGLLAAGGSFVAVLLAVGLPFLLLLQAERRKAADQEAALARWDQRRGG
ncbi:MAG: hypothetical protein JO303_10205 [Caulobacteraceae bacterium]|nr:hypothetical protein [Caulobacteraceae bacterium]